MGKDKLKYDYGQFDKYVQELTGDVYAQPPDKGHTEWAIEVIDNLCAPLKGIDNVLDVGCGQGFLQREFARIGLHWTGVTIGEDYEVCRKKRLNVKNADMTFLPFNDGQFGMVFARHVLEHSPFPLITLMEWHRVCREYLVLVAPSPSYWGWGGKNHYSVMTLERLNWLLKRSGWEPTNVGVFKSKDPKFIKHWEVYQKIKFENGDEAALELLEKTKDLVVEHRIVCKRAEPTLE